MHVVPTALVRCAYPSLCQVEWHVARIYKVVLMCNLSLNSTKRSMSGETSLRPSKFDELCDKLAEKYGENPESVWRETVGDDVADDTGGVDW